MFFPHYKFFVILALSCILSHSASAQSLPSFLEEQAGIWLDLAIYRCEQGDREEAMRLLNIIELEFSPPPGIKKVITYLRSEGCYIKRKPQFKLSLISGWSNNVNQGPSISQLTLGPSQIALELSPSVRPQNDYFAAIEGEWYAAQSPDLSWQLTVHSYAKQYGQQQDFNQQLLGATITKVFKRQEWQWEWRTTANTATLGAHHFQDTIFTGISLERQGWLAESQWGYQQFPHYPAYNAQIWINRFGYQHSLNARSLIRGRLSYILDQAQQQRPGGHRSGLGIDVMGSYIVHELLKTDLLLRYDDNRSKEIYYPGLFDMQRHQRWSEIRLNWLYLLGADQAVQVQLFHNRVHDNVPILAFKQTGISLTWSHLFR